MGINMRFFVSGDRIQIFFDEDEIKIKMSSLLNVSNGSSKSEEFSLNDIEVFLDSEGGNWFKRAHVGIFLGPAKILTQARRKRNLHC